MLGNNLSQFGIDAGQLDNGLNLLPRPWCGCRRPASSARRAVSATSTSTTRSRPASPRALHAKQRKSTGSADQRRVRQRADPRLRRQRDLRARTLRAGSADRGRDVPAGLARCWHQVPRLLVRLRALLAADQRLSPLAAPASCRSPNCTIPGSRLQASAMVDPEKCRSMPAGRRCSASTAIRATFAQAPICSRGRTRPFD